MPRLRLQQLFAEFPIGGEEQPVLRQHQAGGSALGAQFQTVLQEHGGQIVLCDGVTLFAEGAQRFALLAAGEVGHVGDHPVVSPGQQLCCARHSLRGHGTLGLLIVRSLSFQRGCQQCPHRLEAALEEVGLQPARVDERTEHRCLCEQIVECVQAVAEWRREQRVVDTEQMPFRRHPASGRGQLCQREPLFLRRVGRQPRAGEVQIRQGPVSLRAGILPGSKCESESREFHATPIQFQPVQIVTQHGVRRLGGR